jgi:hypothetical protein
LLLLVVRFTPDVVWKWQRACWTGMRRAMGRLVSASNGIRPPTGYRRAENQPVEPQPLSSAAPVQRSSSHMG